MIYCINVRLRSGKRGVYDFGELELKTGDPCVVEEDDSIAFGYVTLSRRPLPESCCQKIGPLPKVIRKATEDDCTLIEDFEVEEGNAFDVCEKKITEHELEMDLVGVEYTFDRKKIIFYFTADGRVDFRELVKDLAQIFKRRIELRQIGVRDEAKLCGGFGTCGLELCCSSFLKEFAPVSIKQAKHQDLALSPTKISGQCGRLLCCLNYEGEVYKEARKGLPKVGTEVQTPKGPGTVSQVVILERKVYVYMGESGNVAIPANFLELDKETGVWRVTSPDFLRP